TLGGRNRARRTDLLGVAGNIANRRVELRNSDGKLFSRSGAHCNALPPWHPAPQWGPPHGRPAKRTDASERAEAVTALNESSVEIGLKVQRLAHATDLLEMRVSLAFQMPIAATYSNADGIVPLVREQCLQLVAPTVAIFHDWQRQIRTQQMVVAAG